MMTAQEEAKRAAKLGTFSTLSIGIGGMVGGGIFAIAAMGSAGFLLIFMAVNLAAVRLARETGGRAWLSALAALSAGVALVMLCVEVDENPATRWHLLILVGMIAASFAIELLYWRFGRRDAGSAG